MDNKIIISYLKKVNKKLPNDFCEADVHYLLMDVFDNNQVQYDHEYYYEDNRFKMDFLLCGNLGLEIKCAKGNIPRPGTLELGLYFPLCENLIYANYYPMAPKRTRLSIFQLNKFTGIQLRYPLKSHGKSGRHYKIGFIGDWDCKPTQRSSWNKPTIWDEILWNDYVNSFEAPKEAINRMSFPRV